MLCPINWGQRVYYRPHCDGGVRYRNSHFGVEPTNPVTSRTDRVILSKTKLNCHGPFPTLGEEGLENLNVQQSMGYNEDCREHSSSRGSRYDAQ
jgi:hypothetical protein